MTLVTSPLAKPRPLPDIGPIRKRSVPRKGNGSWQETGIESNVIQLTATISPSDRIEARLGNLRCSVSFSPPPPFDDLHRASVFGQYNG